MCAWTRHAYQIFDCLAHPALSLSFSKSDSLPSSQQDDWPVPMPPRARLCTPSLGFGEHTFTWNLFSNFQILYYCTNIIISKFTNKQKLSGSTKKSKTAKCMTVYGSNPNPPSESTSVVNTQQDMSVSDDGNLQLSKSLYSALNL